MGVKAARRKLAIGKCPTCGAERTLKLKDIRREFKDAHPELYRKLLHTGAASIPCIRCVGRMLDRSLNERSRRRRRRPQIVDARDLRAGHFRRHPVWINCHTVDQDEHWFDETDEATFRPWDGGTPVHAKVGIFYVRARFHLADGTEHSGFLTPGRARNAIRSATGGELGGLQPTILPRGGKPVYFWYGGLPPRPEKIAGAYRALRKGAGEVFPVTVVADPGLAVGVQRATLKGFYWRDDTGRVRCVRE